MRRQFKNNFLLIISTSFLLSLSALFFFSQHHSSRTGHAWNQVDGQWYAQIKGYPVTYAGFSIENQKIPWNFLKIRNVNWPWVEADNQGAKVYVYFDLRLALPLFLIILAIITIPLVLLNLVLQKKAEKLFLVFNYVLLIAGAIGVIFFYNFSVSWN